MLFTCCTRFAALTSLTAGSAWYKLPATIKVAAPCGTATACRVRVLPPAA